METREQRGIAIADAGNVRQKGTLWVVPSQSGQGAYVVESSTPMPNCSCPDFETRQIKCKHLWAVEYTVRRDITAEGEIVTETLRVTYAQNWPAYNAAQTSEKEHVAVLLRDLCSAIDNPIYKRGRPALPLSDAVFAAVMKVYGTTSGRRAMSDMRDYAAKGYIDKAPHFNSILNALENPILTPILKAMVEESARPLKAIETEFAADASGFATTVYARWFDHKYGRERSASQYVKAHVIVGVTTNVVTSVEITPGYINDYPLLPSLLKSTAARFNVEKLSADKGYSGRSNVAAIAEAGAVPLIAFKSNAKPGAPGPWRQSYEFFQNHRDEFLAAYHKRSNVETTFSMIKAKFGGYVRAKSPVAQVNEVLCKVLAHNLCVLVQSFFEFGIAAEFWHSGRPVVFAPEGMPSWDQGIPPRTPWTRARKKGRQPFQAGGQPEGMGE